MFFGTFTERPYQDDRLYKKMLGDLVISNENYDPRIGAELYDRCVFDPSDVPSGSWSRTMGNGRSPWPMQMAAGFARAKAARPAPHSQVLRQQSWQQMSVSSMLPNKQRGLDINSAVSTGFTHFQPAYSSIFDHAASRRITTLRGQREVPSCLGQG